MKLTTDQIEKFEKLCNRHRPEGYVLKKLRHLAAMIYEYGGSDPDYYAEAFWYGLFKPQMIDEVGFMCDNPELQNCDDYNLVYTVLFGTLAGDDR